MEHLTLGTAAAAGGLLAGASYLNAKYSIGRDLSQLWADRKWRQRFLAKVDALGDHTTIYHMMELCNPEDEALWFEGRSWSYDELRREVDAFAEILWEHGVRAGDFVALMMTNTPEMVIAIVALAKVGAAPAMVNTALRRECLSDFLLVVRRRASPWINHQYTRMMGPDLRFVPLADVASRPTSPSFSQLSVTAHNFHYRGKLNTILVNR